MDNLKRDSKRAINNLSFELPWYLKGRSKNKHSQDRDAFKVKHCVICKTSWEYDRYRTDKIIKYEDFPAYGCAKETCIDCL